MVEDLVQSGRASETGTRSLLQASNRINARRTVGRTPVSRVGAWL